MQGEGSRIPKPAPPATPRYIPELQGLWVLCPLLSPQRVPSSLEFLQEPGHGPRTPRAATASLWAGRSYFLHNNTQVHTQLSGGGGESTRTGLVGSSEPRRHSRAALGESEVKGGDPVGWAVFLPQLSLELSQLHLL